MKRFRFALAKVLDVRNIALKDAERGLARALEEEEQLLLHVQALERRAQEAASGLARALAESTLEPLRLLALHEDLEHRGRALVEGQTRHAEGQRRTTVSREALLKRRAEVESLEILRRKAEDTWAENLRRQEMDAMDELAAQRHQRRKAARTAS
jgi:flagellar export protein FliJ